MFQFQIYQKELKILGYLEEFEKMVKLLLTGKSHFLFCVLREHRWHNRDEARLERRNESIASRAQRNSNLSAHIYDICDICDTCDMCDTDIGSYSTKYCFALFP